MIEPIVTQKISNHPTFPSVERYVDVISQTANAASKSFEFYYKLRYILDGNDITDTLAQPSVNVIYTNDQKKQLLRDPVTFEPIPNPDWDGESEDEFDRYQWAYGWDLIKSLIAEPTNISELIQNYILINDEENYFNI